jgi:superfamily II DNA or RNA helicase
MGQSMRIEDRQYQDDDVNYAMHHGIQQKIIHCAPTGSGKTIIQVKIAKREMERGDSTAILTPRNEIFDQTLTHAGSYIGVENVSILRAKRPGERWDPVAPVHIVSWPTLIARARRSNFWFPDVRRVLVDECHLSMAPKILEILEHYAPKARIDGYTATPARQTGKGLGRFFTEIKHVTSVRRLITDGWLAPCEYWGGATPDLTGIRVTRGDYENAPLSEVCVTLVGDVVDNWLRLASERHTIVFAVDIAHCEALHDRFRELGVNSASLHIKKTTEQREEIVAQFKAGQIQVLVNVSIASYGFDAPSVNCIVIARPTKSIVLHLQMIGRGMRPGVSIEGYVIKDPDHPHFKTCMILDHAGNVTALGMADDLFRWRLDDGKKACENWTKNPESGEHERREQVCADCSHIFSGMRICPKCGWEVPLTKRDVSVQEGDLVRIGKNLVKALPEGWVSHEKFYAMLLHHSKANGESDNWARNQFKKKALCWPEPQWDGQPTVPPDKRVRNFIQSRKYAYGAMQRKLRAQGKIR